MKNIIPQHATEVTLVDDDEGLPVSVRYTDPVNPHVQMEVDLCDLGMFDLMVVNHCLQAHSSAVFNSPDGIFNLYDIEAANIPVVAIHTYIMNRIANEGNS